MEEIKIAFTKIQNKRDNIQKQFNKIENKIYVLIEERDIFQVNTKKYNAIQNKINVLLSDKDKKQEELYSFEDLLNKLEEIIN